MIYPVAMEKREENSSIIDVSSQFLASTLRYQSARERKILPPMPFYMEM